LLLPEFTALENVLNALSNIKETSDRRGQSTSNILIKIGLDLKNIKTTSQRTLSGGNNNG
jgi:ABC-type lipoprotein export system ATPase subunit